MKQNRLILYSVFGVLLLFIFLFSIYMDSQKDNIAFLLEMQGWIWMLKYCSFVLLILFGTNIILHVRDNRRNNREKCQLIEENNALKVKLYDFQQGMKPTEQTLSK